MSGSVCNNNSGNLCLDCGPVDKCNSGGQNLSVCCNNFVNILNFSKDLIALLGELPTEQDFSVVQFGTDVTIASTLESWRQVTKTINQLRYGGGKTNLVGAINSCQETLASSPPDRKNLMLVITDGAPSAPAANPAGVAAIAATNAKNQGTFIIPVFIEDPNNQNSPQSMYLKNSISSDGKVFVADFDGLTSLQESIFEQVTCQARSQE